MTGYDVVQRAVAKVGVVRPNDHGGASVLAVGLIAVLLMIGGAVMFVAAASAAQIAAQHAADEAALAGAYAARAQDAFGKPVTATACAAARDAASEQGATVTRCVTAGAVVTVDVELSRGPARARTRAVAGPAHAAPGRASGQGVGETRHRLPAP